jgi:hypothetical protein
VADVAEACEAVTIAQGASAGHPVIDARSGPLWCVYRAALRLTIADRDDPEAQAEAVLDLADRLDRVKRASH